jgi:glycosyltransferase involved in cell wall biosynthesis
MDSTLRRNIVISAVNLRKGGTLTVLRDCLQYLSSRSDLHVIALVHKRELCDYPGIDYIEIPWSIEGWFKRLKCEYITMYRISRQIAPVDLWFSLHDTTPRVKAKRQAVYCHTPFPFMKSRLRDWQMDYKIALFSLFTRFAYKWNVHNNRYLVVQQSWMREAMSRLLHFDISRIIVAPPAFRGMDIPETTSSECPVFLYPATADVHKDFETLLEAARLLEGRIGKNRFHVTVTVKGDENKYAQWLHRCWSDVDSIEFRGLLPRDELAKAYGEASCLVFTSRAETWGLPISEFLPTGKPMILADLPYAHNTAAGASQVAFFPVTDSERLSEMMLEIIEGKTRSFNPVPTPEFKTPYAAGWDELFDLLLK